MPVKCALATGAFHITAIKAPLLCTRGATYKFW